MHWIRNEKIYSDINSFNSSLSMSIQNVTFQLDFRHWIECGPDAWWCEVWVVWRRMGMALFRNIMLKRAKRRSIYFWACLEGAYFYGAFSRRKMWFSRWKIGQLGPDFPWKNYWGFRIALLSLWCRIPSYMNFWQCPRFFINYYIKKIEWGMRMMFYACKIQIFHLIGDQNFIGCCQSDCW